MRVLVCATDAGGGANTAPVARLLEADDRRVFCSAASERYFRDCGVDGATLWTEGHSVEGELDHWRPDAVLCGTTRYQSPDRDFVQTAATRGVRSVVVLDEWYRYVDRFADARGELRFPTAIAVPDEIAASEAEAEGLPAGRLVVTGSPALAELCGSLDQFVSTPPPLPEVFSAEPRPRLLFLSETHAADFGARPGVHGLLGPFLGYTEHSVAHDLAQAIMTLGRACIVVEKLHPSDDEPRPVRSLAAGQVWHCQGNVPLRPFLWHADVVVGMRSIALLEAALAGKPVLSYQPGLVDNHPPVTSVRLGLVDVASDADGLIAWLDAHWSPGASARRSRPSFARPSAAANVLGVLAGATPAAEADA